jgi:hypothetical protein
MLWAGRLVNLYSKKLINRTGLTLVLAAALLVDLVLYFVWARLYYEFDFQKVSIAALVAVNAGVEYLPADSRAAVRAAEESAEHSGFRREEIAFIGASPDNRALTIRLSREIPWYLAVGTVSLAGREISMTASAHSSQDLWTITMMEQVDVLSPGAEAV